jgi:aldose 1-epimerase
MMKKYLYLLMLTTLAGCEPGTKKPSQTAQTPAPKTYLIRNANGMQATFCENGARITSLLVPGRDGKPVDVVIGFSKPQDYDHATEPYFGATIGRYGNRIAKGKFALDGKPYQLTINNGINTLHGGKAGFQYKKWRLSTTDAATLVCRLISPDGDQGFPGKLAVEVTYHLTPENKLEMSYKAITDQATIVNLTNHAFFNLNGSGSILHHILHINASRYTPVDSTLIPTGQIAEVKNTPFDFTAPATIGQRIAEHDAQLIYGKGYDHNYILNKGAFDGPAAIAIGDQTGIVMKVYTDQPGLQFYSGNFMQGKNRLRNGKDAFRTAFCLETQHFPDAPNHPNFPSTVLRPKKKYQTRSVYAFSVLP